MRQIKVGVIGCGNMGGAIVRGMVGKGSFSADNVFLYDKDEEKVALVAKETGCSRGELSRVVKDSDCLVIAVKPQDFEGLSKEIGSDISGQTIISIMAGIRISDIIGKLGKEVPVARVMPNMAAFISESMTCISFNSLVTLREEIKDIFYGIGKVMEIGEDDMDAVTAVSGSGPAYLFYLADAMVSAACGIGLESGVAEELVLQTLYGAAGLLKSFCESPGDLIDKVASKGGTTEAALSVFSEKDLNSVIKTAIEKAKERSEELSKGK